MYRLVLSAWLVCFSAVGIAQTYYFEQYSVEEGMPVSKVYCLLQDEQGYLWMGTETGAARFDGKRIDEFSEKDGMSPRPVRALMQDASGKIWMGHEGGGLTIFEEGTFTALATDSLGIENDVTAIVQDDDRTVWITTYGSGALRLSNEDWSSARQFKGAQGLSDLVIGVEVLRSGKVIFITDTGLKFQEGGDFVSFDIPGFPAFYQVTTLLQDDDETLWIGTHNGGLYYFEEGAESARFYNRSHGLADNWVTCLTATPSGEIWAGSWGGGLTRIRDGQIMKFNQQNGIEDRKIRDLITDREGNVLIGTNESGLYIFKGAQFVSYTEKDGLINNQVWAICQDLSGRMWFGTNSGITVFPTDRSEGKPKHFNIGNALNANNIRFIERDDDGNMWIASWGGGVQKYNAKSGSFSSDRMIDAEIAPTGNVTAFDLNGPHLWIGTVNGLVHYDRSKRSVQRYSQLDGLPGNDISVVFHATDGSVWLGAAGNGLTHFNIVSGEFTTISMDDVVTPQAIVQSSDGRLYIGTKSNGIFVLKDGEVERQYTVSDGLLGNYIAQITIDHDNNIWVGTNRGLNKIDLKQSRIFTYPEKVGFTGIETKPNATYNDANGNIWFGTVNGAIRNDPKREKHNALPPSINLSGLLVNGVSKPFRQGIELNHDESTVRIEFTGICFTNADDVQYRVLLEGATDKWEDIGDQSYVSYPLLRPGHYTFQVVASNNEGIWNESPATFDFFILPPWYQTRTFYAGSGVLLILFVFSFIKIRERNLKRTNRILEEKVEERTKEVVEQSEEIDRQKGEIERLLLNILPKNISEELRKKGKATAGHYDLVTVLFTDFKGFTNFSERLRPDDLVKELDECFMGFDDIIDDHFIEKIKTIGDAYMCAGGIPIRNKSNPYDVVLAGLRIREFMEQLRIRKESETGDPYWQIRIGIHSGPLIAGVVGKRKFAYDIWGDTVNTASRMESSGEAGKVNISGTTYEIIKEHFNCTYRGKVPAKNKGEIDMYFVDRIKPAYSENADGTLPNDEFKRFLSQIA